MLKNIKKILNLGDKKSIFLLQILIIISSILELTSIVSIIPFLGLLTDDQFIQNNNFVLYVYDFFNFTSQESFIIFFGFLILIFFVISTITILLSRFKLIHFTESFSVTLNNYFYKNFLRKDHQFYYDNSTNYILRTLNDDTFRVVNGIIKPVFNLIARILLAFLIILSLLIYDYLITIILFLILSITYFIIFANFKSKIKSYGDDLAKYQTRKIKIINESFASIKDIVISNKYKFFEDYFSNIIKKISRAHIFVNFINISPRYIIDGVGFSFIILLILFLKTYVNADLTRLLTSVSFLVFAAYKLIPASQEIYSSLVLLKNNKIALDNLVKLLNSEKKQSRNLIFNNKNGFKNKIEIFDLNFNYSKKNIIFRSSNIKVFKNKNHLIVGKSGSGKSTLIEIFLGFIYPQNSKIKIDGKKVEIKSNFNLKNMSSYVSQTPFLLDDTIQNNICFGEKRIKKHILNNAIKLSCSEEFIFQQKDGLNAIVGEKGIKLSGGQRQRINLARAFYQNNDLIILDEATNELDPKTEEKVLSNLLNLKNKTIIVVSHKKTISNKFDYIYKVDNKKIITIRS